MMKTGLKKGFWITSSILVLITGGWLYFRKSSAKPPEWKTALVERGKMEVDVTATGSLSALTTVDVGTQVSGIVAKLFADFNSEVKKGQIIALLDTSILAVTYDESLSILQKASIQLNEMKIEYEREKKLMDENAISKAEFDLALTNYQSAQSSLKTAEAQLKRARINRQYAVIRAPIKGTVISRNVDVGQTVISAFNSPVLYVIANDLRKMQVYANVDEADIGQVKVGQEVKFGVDAYPGENFNGKVNQIRLQPVVVQNVVTYIVVIDVENPDLKLLPGLTANINFKVKEHDHVLKVQTAALQFMPSEEFLKNGKYPEKLIADVKRHQGKNKISGDSAYVWKKKNNMIYPEPVSIGIVSNGLTEISGNIHEGDELVTRIKTEDKPATQNPFMPSFRPRKM